MERDKRSITVGKRAKISTHTLTWSVTYVNNKEMLITEISTHTLTWSVTNFNMQEIMCKIISTHTLTWSVTVGNETDENGEQFQLTRSRGA